MQTVLSLTPKQALEYFMDAEQYCGIALPSYINFQPILDYVKTTIGAKELANCLKEEKQYPSKFDQVNYKILVNKDGKYAYRPIQIANPYLYYLLVRSITTKDSWEALQNRFDEFKDSHIEVSSIPPMRNKKDKSTLATIISNWWSNLEQRSIELSIKYKYMFITDIPFDRNPILEQLLSQTYDFIFEKDSGNRVFQMIVKMEKERRLITLGRIQ